MVGGNFSGVAPNNIRTHHPKSHQAYSWPNALRRDHRNLKYESKSKSHAFKASTPKWVFRKVTRKRWKLKRWKFGGKVQFIIMGLKRATNTLGNFYATVLTSLLDIHLFISVAVHFSCISMFYSWIEISRLGIWLRIWQHNEELKKSRTGDGGFFFLFVVQKIFKQTLFNDYLVSQSFS
jgi:hypothetical protein